MSNNILEYYKYVHQVYDVKQPFIPKSPEQLSVGKLLVPDIKNLTLVEYDVDTKNYITAHRMSDYRKSTFSIRLLPHVHTLFDTVLEGSTYWNAKLHNEG